MIPSLAHTVVVIGVTLSRDTGHSSLNISVLPFNMEYRFILFNGDQVMSREFYIISIFAAFEALFFLFPLVLSTYFMFRGTRVITCP
jgi:hypothetical protein